VLDIVSHPMRVESARDLNADIDREGFTLARHDSAVSDWRDPAQIAGVYAPELAALVQRVTGADEVKVSPHGILRFRKNRVWRAAATIPTRRALPISTWPMDHRA
jgi:hypothetical protein